MTDLEFNSSREEYLSPPAERFRRDEYRQEEEKPKIAAKDERRERRHREAIKNRALVQVVSAAAAVVVVGNSLGVDYLGDFFGISAVVEAIESADGISIPDEYAAYLEHLLALCAENAEDKVLFSELNGEFCYTMTKYFESKGYEDMYYFGGRLHAGLPSPLNDEPGIFVGFDGDYMIGLVYFPRTGDIVAGGECRCALTGVAGTAGSVSHSYSGTAGLDSENWWLYPVSGIYTVYEGVKPSLTLSGSFSFASDPQYAEAKSSAQGVNCTTAVMAYLENGVITFREGYPADQIPDPVNVADGWLSPDRDLNPTLSSFFGGKLLNLDLPAGSGAVSETYETAIRGTAAECMYHTSLQMAWHFCQFKYDLTPGVSEAMPDQYRDYLTALFDLFENGATDEALRNEIFSDTGAAVAKWLADNAPGALWNGSQLTTEPAGNAMELRDSGATYYEDAENRGFGATTVDIGGDFSFRGVMSGSGSVPMSGDYVRTLGVIELRLSGSFTVDKSVWGLAEPSSAHGAFACFLENGDVSIIDPDNDDFTGEVHNGYLKYESGDVEVTPSDYYETGYALYINSRGMPSLSSGLGSALYHCAYTETVYSFDDYEPESVGPTGVPKPELTDEVKSALDELMAACRTLMSEGDKAYDSFRAALIAANEKVTAAGLNSELMSTWYAGGELNDTPTSGEALKLSATSYGNTVCYCGDMSVLLTGTPGGVQVHDNDTSRYIYIGTLSAGSYYDSSLRLGTGVYIEMYSYSGEAPEEMTRMEGLFVLDDDGGQYLHSGTLVTESLAKYPLTVVDGSLQLGGSLSASIGPTSWSDGADCFTVQYVKDEYSSYSNSTMELRGSTVAENLYHSFMQRVNAFGYYSS